MMLTVTNGSVSRTFKPADYEGRTVTLSFNIEPGGDLDSAITSVVALCEHYARTKPPELKAANPAQGKRIDPPTQAQTSAPVPASPPAPTVEQAVVEITDVDLRTACQAASVRMGGNEKVREIHLRYTNGNTQLQAIPMDKRAAFVAEVEALKPASTDY